ncbi:cellulose synthase-like protein G3 [Euphorbia lathyris]|uniref:cellulose synthase-like protein G3 n=1 Tax=Euphorbia lathyris TaxID=212925 RepID=UPI0033138E18
MAELRTSTTTTSAADAPPLHTVKPMPQTIFNRVFAPIYGCAILSLFYHHAKNLIHSPTISTFCITLTLVISDMILTLMWINMQALRMYPVRRQEFPENLKKIIKESEYPGLDVFICTADPYKEPPISVVNTALSVMAYDYPREKVSVYVSDDGGSALTLFALMEAAKFATHWLPFCDENKLLNRSPQAYFDSKQGFNSSNDDHRIKKMYESMKLKIEKVVERGKVEEEYINGDEEKQKAFNKWTHNFTRHHHPTVIQVLLDGCKDKDMNERSMPNLIYVSREKDKNSPHRFKAGALNTLLRVSSIMTNAPIILTLDCDMYSNNPQTPLDALCYLCDPKLLSKVGYVQFPQRFHKINKNDTYGCAYKRLFYIQSIGFDGLKGPNHVGTGCFFSRRVFFGGPSTLVPPEIPQLSPPYPHLLHNPNYKPLLHSQSVLALAHQVSTCNYENNTNWGSKIGYKYGSLVEDYYTGYRLQCEGWNSIFSMPKSPAFLGDAPISLIDLLNQQKRWAIGLLEVAFSRYSPITFGVKSMGPLMGLGYGLLSFWPLWSIPVTTYAFLPQLALLNNLYIFPQASETKWLSLYIFLFLGANTQDLIEFILVGGSVKSWWNDQRIWYIRGLTCYLFGLIEYILHTFGISKFGFNVTSKADDDDELRKRYDQGMFEFGVHSPMFVTISMAAFINFISLFHGLFQAFRDGNLEGSLLQILLSGFVVFNCCPVYEAVFLRADNGKIPFKTSVMAAFLIFCFYFLSFFLLV